MTRDNVDTNRRQFMKRAAAGAVGLATVGAEGAVARGPRLEDRHAEPVNVAAAFEESTGDLFDLLAAEGLLADGPAALPTDRRVSAGALTSDPEGTAYFRLADRPDFLKSVKHVDGGVLKVSVTPETGDAHAVFVPEGEDAQYLYDPTRGYAGVERSDVSTSESCTCEDIGCDGGYGYSKLCCDDSGCYWDGCC